MNTQTGSSLSMRAPRGFGRGAGQLAGDAWKERPQGRFMLCEQRYISDRHLNGGCTLYILKYPERLWSTSYIIYEVD